MLQDDVVQASEPALTRMLGRPFGRDDEGNPIDHGSGSLVVSTVNAMLEMVAARASRETEGEAGEAERAQRLTEAKEDALARLIGMLNAAIGDTRYEVTAAYLFNERNRYSYEFRLFVSAYCRQISGDAAFYRHAGERGVPESLAKIARPLGVQRVYQVMPRLMAKVVKTDLRVARVDEKGAAIRWYGGSQIEKVPAPHQETYIRYACEMYQGAMGAITHAVFGMPMAEVRETQCQADGAECCEWHIAWVETSVRGGRRVLAGGAAASALLVGVLVAGVPLTGALAVAGAAVPLLLAWHIRSERRMRALHDVLQRQVMEERDLAEHEFDQSEQANANLQIANLDLSQRVRELTLLHESSLRFASTLEVSEVVDAALGAVVRDLGYERAVALLADDGRQMLRGGRVAGGTPEMAALIARLEVPFAQAGSPLVRVLQAGEPLEFGFERGQEDEGAQLFGGTRFVGLPLVTNGKRVGILVVDWRADRPLDGASTQLLATLGGQIAAAVEAARLYEEIEAQNRTLEQRVAQRTEELAQTAAELKHELAERQRMRERELEYLEQVNRVVSAAVAVEANAFDPASLDDAAARDDELGQLARTFRRMANDMIERERRLTRQVQDLRIEIDKNRQAKDVAEIVDSEYFQTLRSQAKDLRRIAGMK